MNALSVTDVFGDSVSLPVSRWQTHILATHPELKMHLDDIAKAIGEPHCVYESETDTAAKLFFRRGAVQGKYRNLYLKVVVSYATKPAIVKTAFFTNTLQGGKLLWIRFP